MNRTRTIPLLAIAAVAGVLAGCGGGSSETTTQAQPAAQWASDLCSAASTWKTSVTSATEPLKGGNISKDTLQTAAGDIKDATDTLVNDVKALGPPDTQSGKQAKDVVDKLADDLSSGVDKLKQNADNLSSASDAVTAVSTMGATLATMADQVSAAVDKIQKLDAKGELESAIKNEPECDSLLGSSS